MQYSIRTSKSEHGYKHEMLRDEKITTYAEYSSDPRIPGRMKRWLKKLNGGRDGNTGAQTRPRLD